MKRAFEGAQKLPLHDISFNARFETLKHQYSKHIDNDCAE